MADERAALPTPRASPRRPAPLNLAPPPGPALNGNGKAHGINGDTGTNGHPPLDVEPPQPSPRTKRFTPVRALRVGNGAVAHAPAPLFEQSTADPLAFTESPPCSPKTAATPGPPGANSTSATANGPNAGPSQTASQAASQAPLQFTPSRSGATLAAPGSGGAGAGPSRAASVGGVAKRRMSAIDRRVRSDALPSHRRQLISSRRPSIMTGGYESSSDEGRGHADRHEAAVASSSSGRAPQSPRRRHGSLLLNGSTPHQGFGPGAGRRRAQSLLATAPLDFSPAGIAAGGSPGGSRRASRFGRPVPTGSPLRTPVTPQVTLSRTASDVQSRSGAAAAGSGVDSPFNAPTVLHTDTDDNVHGDDLDSRRHAKQRKMARDQRNNPLALSLGLSTGQRPPTLSPDQIQDLFSGADVSSAMNLMAAPMHRQSSTPAPPDNFLTPSPRPQQQSQPSPFTSPAPSPALPESDDTPPLSTRPYLVTAPPALTNGDWKGRERAGSIASSIATTTNFGTPHRNVTPMHHHHSGRRARAVSAATSDTTSEGGHGGSSFATHLPPMLAGDSDIDEEPPADASDDDDDKPPVDKDASLTVTEAPAGDGDGATTAPTTAPPTVVSPSPVPPADHHHHKREDSRTKDDKAHRRISGLFGLRKKRDASPAPAPAATAHKPPPALSPSPAPTPAPVRPAETAARKHRDREAEMRRAEQERRENELMQELRYRAMMQVHNHPMSQKRAQRAATHLDGYYSLVYQGLENPPKFNPLAVLRWTKRMEEQKEARLKWEREHGVSTRLTSPLPWQAASPVSPGLPLLASPGRMASPLPSNQSHMSKDVIAPGWHYSLTDANAYNECGGKVDFFIPPTPQHQDVQLPEDQPQSNGGDLSLRSEAHLSVPSLSSAGDKAREKEKDGALVTTTMVSPSTTSLVPPDVDPALDDDYPLSRTTSFEARRPMRRGRHRNHQSTSGIPTSTPRPIGQTLRAFGSGVKTLTFGGATSSPDHDNIHAQQQGHQHTPPSAAADAPYTPQNQVSANSLREHRNVFGLRRAPVQDGNATSDDDHHHFRRLIAKGRGATIDRFARRGVSGVPAPTTLDPRRGSRVAEIQNLQTALQAAEMQEPKKSKRNELALQTAERIHQVESELYADREEYLRAVQRRLEQVDHTSKQMDASIGHFLGQLDQVRSVFKTAADVDVKFENLDGLRRPQPRRDTDDEEADSLSPLRDESDVGGFSDRSQWIQRPRPQRMSSSGVQNLNLPSFAFGLQAWPKRSTVDPTLGVSLDPIGRVEMSCDKAREAIESMRRQRANATRRLQDMVNTVNKLIRQKDVVRAWAKAANERIANLKAERTNISLKIRGGVKPRMWRATDVATDLLARSVMGIFSVGVRTGRVFNSVRGRSWVAWSLLGAIVSMLIMFYFVGDAVVDTAHVAAAATSPVPHLAALFASPQAIVS